MASRTPFTYRAWDFRTLEPLDPLPYTTTQFGKQVNGEGRFAGLLPLTSKAVQKFDWRNATMPGKTIVGIDVEGDLLWGGIIWSRRYKRTTGQLEVSGSDLNSYWAHRFQEYDYTETFTLADPMAIAKRVLEDSIAGAGASVPPGGGPISLPIAVVLHPGGGSGQTLTVSYPAQQSQLLSSILQLLSSMGYGFGFDYSTDVTYATGTRNPQITVNLWYPRMGRGAGEDSPVFGVDCSELEWPEDASNQAWQVKETGAGGGLAATLWATEVGEAGWPPLQKVSPRSQVTEEAALERIGKGDLSQWAWPITTPTLTVPLWEPEKGLNAARFGMRSFELGDDATVRFDAVNGSNRNVDPRFPDGLDFDFRITTYTVTVGPNNAVLQIPVTQPPTESTNPPRPPA